MRTEKEVACKKKKKKKEKNNHIPGETYHSKPQPTHGIDMCSYNGADRCFP